MCEIFYTHNVQTLIKRMKGLLDFIAVLAGVGLQLVPFNPHNVLTLIKRMKGLPDFIAVLAGASL